MKRDGNSLSKWALVKYSEHSIAHSSALLEWGGKGIQLFCREMQDNLVGFVVKEMRIYLIGTKHQNCFELFLLGKLVLIGPEDTISCDRKDIVRIFSPNTISRSS